MKTTKIMAVVLSLVMVFTLCITSNGEANAASKVKLNKKKMSLEIGKTGKLKLKNAKGKVTWKSSNKSVATVSSKGVVKAISVGSAKIIAKNNKKSYSCSVTVKASEPVYADDGRIKVAIINSDAYESGYRTANDKDLRNVFTTENGYNVRFYNNTFVTKQQSKAIEYINAGADYLVISPTDPSGWESVLKKAKNAGTRVIFFDNPPEADSGLYVTSLVTDPYKEGELAVNWLESQGYDQYNILHIQGMNGMLTQLGRSKAIREKVGSSDNWNFVVQKSADWNAENAEKIVSSAIKNHKEFNVIYAENDDMARGAVTALDKAGISHGVGGDVCIVGFDCNKWALEEVYNGNWNCDIQCSPFYASYIDKVIKDIESGNTISEKTIVVEDKVFDSSITLEDIDKYGI